MSSSQTHTRARRRTVARVVAAAVVAGALQFTPLMASAAQAAPAADGTNYTNFRPGEEWLDNNGNTLQAHGGQVVPATDADGKTIYYLYGEDRTNGYESAPGVHVYSSYDLYNWTDQGLALRAMQSKSQFDEDPYFQDLYGDYSSEQKDAVWTDLATTPDGSGAAAIIERPKAMYNAKTGKWIMWAHMDGGTPEWPWTQYAKAKAGVAISDSPFGPFRYIGSSPLNSSPEGWGTPGMARDMNVFVDDDGVGYIIYSSEENATMFISKLDAEYTGLATPADQAVLGVDYNRIFVGQSRESPAIFKHDERYFLITSGTSGWSPNPARWGTATDIMGDWTDKGDPFPWWAQSNSWDTQPSSVIPVDREKGKYIYMGDRWNGASDLKNAQLVWLPLNLGQSEGGDTVAVEVYDTWTLEDLDQWTPWDVTGAPAAVRVGGAIDTPTVTVTRNGEESTQPVTWEVHGSLDTPGSVTVTGTLPEYGGHTFTRSVAVVPENVRYAVNAGGVQTRDWAGLMDIAQQDSTVLNSGSDQAFGVDPKTGKSWGYISDGSKSHGGIDGDMFSTMRYAVWGQDLTYRFQDLAPGKYSVHAGYFDPWDEWDERGANVFINGNLVKENHDYWGSNDEDTYDNITVGDEGEISFTLSRTRDTDVQLSWLIITADEAEVPVTPELDVTFTANTKCVADKLVVTTALTSAAEVPVSVTVASEFGSKTIAAVAPGKNGAHAFTTRKASLPAGTVTATVEATIDGTLVSRVVEATYAAASCE